MSAYVEVMIKGNCRVFLEASGIMGVITSPGCQGDFQATVEEPMSLLMRSGDTLEGVYGISPNRLLIHLAGVRMIARDKGRLCVVGYIDKHAELEEQIAAMLPRDG